MRDIRVACIWQKSLDALFQGFSNGALDPLGGHGAVLWGPRAEAFAR